MKGLGESLRGGGESEEVVFGVNTSAFGIDGLMFRVPCSVFGVESFVLSIHRLATSVKLVILFGVAC